MENWTKQANQAILELAAGFAAMTGLLGLIAGTTSPVIVWALLLRV